MMNPCIYKVRGPYKKTQIRKCIFKSLMDFSSTLDSFKCVQYFVECMNLNFMKDECYEDVCAIL